MLEIEALGARAGGFRLAGVSLTVEQGECHAVLGPSGSGKSTLLNAVLGTLPIVEGRVRLAGQDITHLPVERRHLGYVPQHLGLFPHLSVADNLSYSARARRVAEAEYRPLLDRLTEITGIGALLSRRIGTLSGGERQRVALVRALAANPRLVLLDEPFTALNASLRRELWALLKDLQRERGLTVMIVTHDLTEAYVLADHITVLIDGRQEQSGDKRTLFRRPASLPVAHFLGLKNLFPATVTARGEGHVEADVPGLGARVRLPGEAPVGMPIHVGIRPEDVALRDDEHPPRPGEWVVRGRARLIDLGADALLQVEPCTGGPRVELIASWRTLHRFGLAQDRTEVMIALPEAEMFWVGGPAPAEAPG